MKKTAIVAPAINKKTRAQQLTQTLSLPGAPESQLRVEVWSLNRIKPYAKNPRKNTEAVAGVAASIKEFGWKQPIVVDKFGVIVVGDTRYRAAQQLGHAGAPVVVAADLSPAQAKAYRLADNRTNENATWDNGLLAAELADLRLENYDLALTGFEDVELRAIAALARATVAGRTEPDAVPHRPKKAISVPGDVWILGTHRVVCGDAREVTAVEKALDGTKAALIVTDPPYNVGYDGQWEHKTKRAKIANDKQSSEDFGQLLQESFTTMYACAAPGASIYVFHADMERVNFVTAFLAGGFKLSQICVWVKNSFVVSRQDYHWKHEPILYGWHPGGSHKWHGNRSQTTAWLFDRPSASEQHPTMKPISMLCYAIENSSAPGEVVLDPFGGSGSTLIACEKLGRACAMVELDPNYVDVIVRRWEEFTGKKAKRLGSNGTDSPTKKSRANMGA